MKSIILAVLKDRERRDPQKCLISESAALEGSNSNQEAFSHPLTSYQGSWAHCLSFQKGVPFRNSMGKTLPSPAAQSPTVLTRRKLSPPTCPPFSVDTSARCIRPRDIPREAILPSQAGPFLGVLRIRIEGHGQIRWVPRVPSSLRALEKQGPHLLCCD